MQRLVRRASGALALVGLALCVLSIRRQWGDAQSLDLQLSAPTLAAAVLAAVVTDLLMASAWVHLVRSSGGAIDRAPALRVWWTGQLARFVPTGLGSLPGRLVAGAGAGLPRRLLVVTTTAELGVAAATSVAAAALLVEGPPGVGLAAAALAAVCVAAGAAGPRLLPAAPGAGRAWVSFVLLHALKLVVRAGGLWALLHLTTAAAPPDLRLVLGAVGAAYALGLAAVFAPGGIGVREAALAATLGSAAGASPAAVIAAALLWRLLETAVEPPLLLATRLLPRAPEPATGAQP